MVAHNDWRGIVRWINSLRLERVMDPYGRLCLHSSARWVSHNNKKHKRKKRHRRRQTSRESDNYCDMDSQSPEFSKLIQKVKNVMQFSSDFICELITNELAKRGVFLSDIDYTFRIAIRFC